MSDTNWTPGPWAAFEDQEPDGSWAGGYDILTADSHCFIGSVFRSEAGNETDWNAHLVAAAPDLYETLESLYQDNWNDAPLAKRRRSWAKAKAALAKARGESDG